MNIVHAEYNKYHNIIDINYYNGYILRIDCGANSASSDHRFR